MQVSRIAPSNLFISSGAWTARSIVQWHIKNTWFGGKGNLCILQRGYWRFIHSSMESRWRRDVSTSFEQKAHFYLWQESKEINLFTYLSILGSLPQKNEWSRRRNSRAQFLCRLSLEFPSALWMPCRRRNYFAESAPVRLTKPFQNEQICRMSDEPEFEGEFGGRSWCQCPMSS